MAIRMKSFDKIRKYLPWSAISQKIIEKYCTSDKNISNNSISTIETNMDDLDTGSISEDSAELPESPIKMLSKSFLRINQFIISSLL
jgi:hypothetical protein